MAVSLDDTIEVMVVLLTQQAPRTPATGNSRSPVFAAALLVATSISLLTCAATISLAQIVRGDLDEPYGSVLAQAQSGNTLYIGGDFAHVGPLTSGVVTLSSTTGHLVRDFGIRGFPNSSISDGAGGWYLAGDFGSAGRTYDRVLMHIRADGSSGSLDPHVNGTIWAMALSGPTLYLGGNFSNIDGKTRWQVAAIDVQADTVTSWDAKISTSSEVVASLAVAKGLVYIGGIFH